MSGFDVQMRSDALVLPMRQHAADQEVASIRATGEAVNNMLQVQQQQETHNARIAGWEIERQIGQRKLLEMQALDQSEISRLTVEQQRQQVRAMRLANNEMEERAKQLGPRDEFKQRRFAIESSIYKDDPLKTYDSTTGEWRDSTEDEQKARSKARREERYGPVGSAESLVSARYADSIAKYTKLADDELDEVRQQEYADIRDALIEKARMESGGGAPRKPREKRLETPEDGLNFLLKNVIPGGK